MLVLKTKNSLDFCWCCLVLLLQLAKCLQKSPQLAITSLELPLSQQDKEQAVLQVEQLQSALSQVEQESALSQVEQESALPQVEQESAPSQVEQANQKQALPEVKQRRISLQPAALHSTN